MKKPDIRWHQRLQNFEKAFEQLKIFMDHDHLNEMEEQGLIQCFEYNFELSWNTLKDFYEEQGVTNLQGSKDVFRIAFQRGLIEHGEVWLDMVRNRSLTSHTYNSSTSSYVVSEIKNNYFPLFKSLLLTLQQKRDL